MYLKSNPNIRSIQVFLQGTGFYIKNKSGKEITNPRGKKTPLCLNQIFLEKDRLQYKLQKNEICYKGTPNLVKGKQI